MDPKIFWELSEAYQAGVYHQVDEDVLSEEEYLDIQEWVENLIAEGYDLDEYTDDELYEAYLDELYEAKEDEGKTKEEKVRARRQRQGSSRDWDPDDSARQTLHRNERGTRQRPRVTYGTVPGTYTREQQYMSRLSPEERQKRMEQNRRGLSRKLPKVNLPEEFDLYDVISDYLVNEGYCDTYEDADVIMANMSEEWRDEIIEATVMRVTSPEGKERSLNFAKAKPARNLEGKERLDAARTSRQQKVDRSFADPRKVSKFRRRYGLPG